ncbi:pyruvate, water dikinase [Nocardia amikacinitolerans]|uniref:Pyruvate, water dikinase n=1 Tax=Nocardia amikacinitolerans TaxID=756689 RepID=A0A285KV59_9NOCA|nr:PEP/pyruvate-binding domain-containing protein [Nocardia amikacinitolerans]SNY76519.1 pyruvate, water dikinase [Nocardia amikacinitolerans]
MKPTNTGAVVPAATLAARPDAAPEHTARFGAKAANLGRLLAAGHRVPPFAVVTTEACAEILAPVTEGIAQLLGTLDHTDPASLRSVSAAIRGLILGLALPAQVAAELDAAVAEWSDVRLAVRSSVSGEDSATDSFAGQLDTILNVAPAGVAHALLEVLASAYSERSLFYRAHRGLDNSGVECAVLVQVLVESVVSGVVFSCNPQTGDPAESVVSAALGLGEGVVAGTVECDTYFVDNASGSIVSRNVVDKRSRVVADAGSGTAVAEIAGGSADPALTDERILQLTRTAAALADAFGAPQDVEWAYDADGTLFLLQARPVTATGARETIFDNVNVAESYPGLSSPLTFSILRAAYEQVFRACHRDFGATGAIVDRNAASLYPYLVGTAHGRIYYNISNWYRLFLQIPGMEFAIEGWEAALNIENRYQRPATPKRGLARLRMYALRVRVFAIIGAGWLRLPRRLRAFFTELAAFTADLDRRLDPETPERERDPEALLQWMERCLGELVPAYSVQIFNDFLAQQLFHVVGLLLERQGLDETEAITLRNELFCGEEGVDSVDPVRSALALTATIRDDSALRALFTGPLDAATVWKTLAQPEFAAFRAACLRHIALFGDRTVDELKLETDPLGEHPERLVPMLRNYLRGGQNIDEMAAREKAIRREAERTAAALFRDSFARRLAFRLALGRAREHVKQRENMRLGRSRSFGLVKRVFREFGKQMHGAGLLDDPRDIFWLTYEEIAALTRGTAVDTDAARTVATRKRDHERWRDTELPTRIVTTGIAAASIDDPAFDAANSAVDATAQTVLRGIGCAPGRVEAPALVLGTPDPEVEIDGQILVASTTDPGWVFLMVAAGGLVSEKGSVLSHTAIIGRELGIPTVVGVPGVTRLVATGDRLVLDGRAGTATIVREDEQ